MPDRPEPDMPLTLCFDVYGTLIDPHGVVVELESMVGDEAAAFSNIWRSKQLEYTWRRALMNQYQPFPVCTRQALEFTMHSLGIKLDGAQQRTLIEAYDTLPAYADAKAGLDMLADAGWRLYAFSNGQADAVNRVLQHAGIAHHFHGTVSVDEIQTFKPHPGAYEHMVSRAGGDKACSWLVSSNSFDVGGAVSAGMKAAWIQRDPGLPFDAWEFQPTITLPSLLTLHESIAQSVADK